MWDEKMALLKERLGGELPGLEAQMQMAPYLRDRANFEFPSNDSTRPGGVLILLYPKDGELHLPLMLRTSYAGAHSGQISFPGGKHEPEDDTLISTALREAEEEMGIPSTDVEVVGSLTSLYISVSNFKVLPVVGFMPERPSFTRDPIEVEEIIETPVANLLHPETKDEKDIKVAAGFQLRAPFYHVDGHTVWGATAMVMSEFLTVYKDL